MVNIFCTKKLETLIGTVSKNSEIQETNNNWTGNLLMINGKKCIMFVDKKTLYIILILNFSVKDLPRLKEIFLKEFINQLKRDDIHSPEIENYFIKNFNEIKFFKTDNDQNTLGTLKNAASLLKRFHESEPSNNIGITYYQTERMNHNPITVREYAMSKKLLLEDLKSNGIIT